MPSPRKGLGLGMDELEQLVSSTFRDFDLYNPDLQLEQLLAPPSTFEDHEPSRIGAETPAPELPARPPSRLATTTTLLRKVKSQASALLASRSSSTPRPPKSPAIQPRERTKSASKPIFPFRRGSASKEPLPPVPPLPRTPAANFDQESTHLPYPTRTYTPIPPSGSPSSLSSHGSPSSKTKRRGRLPSVFESDDGAARALSFDKCEPPSPPPKSPRHNLGDSKPLGMRLHLSTQKEHNLSVYSPHPDSLWTPELTNASPSRSSPASSSQSSTLSTTRSPITPSNEETAPFDSSDDPFRKADPPSQPRLSLDSSPPRPRVPRSKSTPKMHKFGIRPTPSPSLHPTLTLASASGANLPHHSTVGPTPHGALISSPSGSSLFLPFPLPPDAAQDTISVRVATPVSAAFPPARPPPVRPLPKTPPGSPWHPPSQPRTAPATQTTFGFPSPRRNGGKGLSYRSTKRSLSRSASREKLSALRQMQAAKSLVTRPLPSKPHNSTPPPTSFDAFLAYAAPRPQPSAPMLHAPPLGRRRRRPSSPFPLLEPTPAAEATRAFASAGDTRAMSPEPHPRPPRAARQEVRAVVDAMLGSEVSFTNPWTSPTLSTSDMESHLDMLPDSDVEPDNFNWKKASVSSASTVSSTRTASSMATQSTVTNATTVSPSTSPDTTSPYIPIAPLPLDCVDDPLGLATRSAAPWARIRPAFEDRSKSSVDSRGKASLDRPRPSYDSDGKAETYYTARSRPSSPRRSETDAPAFRPLLPAPYVPAADITAVRQAQSPVPFPRMMLAPRTAPAHIATFVQAEREREQPTPLLRITAPSPSVGNSSGSPSGARKRRSFLPLPAIPRIAPLDFGILGHSSEREESKSRRGTGSSWFD
ncbi:hypothetical protein PENSPDRAFT_679095 [Peniophora sp. CONT]|nr:hypothetical protein PENSPDRAFT_679095 [Peniophora sp. CONT]